MFVSTHWISSIAALSLIALVLTGCSKDKVAGSGPPATEQQIARMLSGNSFNTHANGQVYQSSNGTIMSFSYHPYGPRVCKGTWRVDGSEEVDILTCRWVKGGKIYVIEDKEIRYQLRHSSAYGMDMIDEDGVFVGFLPYRYGKTYGSSKYRGFPQSAEYNKLSRRLGL